MASPLSYKLYFSGNDDARDGCLIIGEDTRPVFFELDTSPGPNYAVTTTISSDRAPVAAFDWYNSGNDFGIATIGNRELPMAHLVMPGSCPNARTFTSADGRQYEWRRCYNDPQSYELYAQPNVRIAYFRRFPQETPIGISHAYFEYGFNHPLLLLEALLALSLNRWLDWGL
ncbi:hypothetical protein BJ138DRAFT_1180114 [Hygrophoropsis aurantiaca]|uniref:Uncharacterized protein n=1 Tax=Hygrophoropsis aurantiaca TaxID=72124 RepID=A0ACB8AB13_9AGAM|nr:hypothetical protein BJ138DRAFT_1180114 [Hygrophoropsis aurantiaca]